MPYCFSGFFQNWDRRRTSTPCELSAALGSERLRGKQVENKERHFQGVAKGKYARTSVCLTMKTMDLKRFMLHFILNGYGDNHHLLTRDKSPENIGSFKLNCYSCCFQLLSLFSCDFSCMQSNVLQSFLCNVYIK